MNAATDLEAVRREPHGGRSRVGWRWLASTSLLTGFWIAFFAAHLSVWSKSHRPVGLGAVVLELVFALLFVARRQPLVVSRAPLAWVSAAAGSFGMLAARPHYAPIGGYDAPCLALQLGGSAAAVFCLFTLGRSFGVVAANRGLRTQGPYQIVRHPVYACYLVVTIGYLLENPSPWNVLVVIGFTTAQLLRIREEENCLAADPDYVTYRSSVRYRLVPYVY